MDDNIVWGQGQAILTSYDICLCAEDGTLLTTEDDYVLATELDPEVTNPDLHRRIDTDLDKAPDVFFIDIGDGTALLVDDDEALLVMMEKDNPLERNYALLIKGFNSYRTTRTKLHYDEDEDSEIP